MRRRGMREGREGGKKEAWEKKREQGSTCIDPHATPSATHVLDAELVHAIIVGHARVTVEVRLQRERGGRGGEGRGSVRRAGMH